MCPVFGAQFSELPLVAINVSDTSSSKDSTARDGKPKAKGKRKRGPSEETLESCKQAMIEWLDNHADLQKAAELCMIDDETILRWIPNVLELTDSPKREKWIALLRALGKEKHLGKFSDV